MPAHTQMLSVIRSSASFGAIFLLQKVFQRQFDMMSAQMCSLSWEKWELEFVEFLKSNCWSAEIMMMWGKNFALIVIFQGYQRQTKAGKEWEGDCGNKVCTFSLAFLKEECCRSSQRLTFSAWSNIRGSLPTPLVRFPFGNSWR